LSARGCAATRAARTPSPLGGEGAWISVPNRRGIRRWPPSTRRSPPRAADAASEWSLARVWVAAEQNGSTRRADPPVRSGRRVDGGIAVEHHAAASASPRGWFSVAGCRRGVVLDDNSSRVDQRVKWGSIHHVPRVELTGGVGAWAVGRRVHPLKRGDPTMSGVGTLAARVNERFVPANSGNRGRRQR